MAAATTAATWATGDMRTPYSEDDRVRTVGHDHRHGTRTRPPPAGVPGVRRTAPVRRLRRRARPPPGPGVARRQRRRRLAGRPVRLPGDGRPTGHRRRTRRTRRHVPPDARLAGSDRDASGQDAWRQPPRTRHVVRPGAVAERALDHPVRPLHARDRGVRMVAELLRHPGRAAATAEVPDGAPDRLPDLAGRGLVGLLQRRGEQRLAAHRADVETRSEAGHGSPPRFPPTTVLRRPARNIGYLAYPVCPAFGSP